MTRGDEEVAEERRLAVETRVTRGRAEQATLERLEAEAALSDARRLEDEAHADFRRAEEEEAGYYRGRKAAKEMAADKTKSYKEEVSTGGAKNKPEGAKLSHTQAQMEAAAQMLRRAGAGEYKHLALQEENQIAIVQIWAVDPLVQLLRTGDAGGKAWAACVLMNLARCPDNRTIIAKAGALEPLVQVLRVCRDPVTKQWAAGALRYLAGDSYNQIAIIDAGAADPLVQLVHNGNPEGKRQAGYALSTLAMHADNQVPIAQAWRAVQRGVSPPAKLCSQIQHPGSVHVCF